jgi:hypothetical protein
LSLKIDSIRLKNLMGDFFLWCAGSDTKVLSKCDEYVRTKHVGLGTLVLIPAVLGFISMSYALSTIDKLSAYPLAYITGGFVWGTIIFAFDRYIVSTHRKQESNFEEFKNITFYLRLFFAFILGIVISHPFVLLYFDGSISERIVGDRDKSVINEENIYQKKYDTLTLQLKSLIQTKRCNEQLLTAEQSGKKIDLPCGSSSGIPNVSGNFPRTQEIKKIIADLDTEIKNEQNRINLYSQNLAALKSTTQSNIIKNTSFDYLKREVTLSQLKKENLIVRYTEFLLMLAFILVDILPLVFKTFSPFTMYDKVIVDDVNMLRSLNIDTRKIKLQSQYDYINEN